MRICFISIIVVTSFISCDNNISFGKEYYEAVSDIHFPEKFKVLEQFDNGEWLTGLVLKLDSSSLLKLVTYYHFDTLRDLKNIHLLSESYLISNRPNFSKMEGIYFLSKSKNKNSWTYIADLNTNKLWAEISYPDFGGQ